MRVKNDHPNTTERPQQVQQRPVNQVSEELESRFNNALKPTQAESEHDSETSRLFAAVLNADKLDGMKHKGKVSSAIPEAGKSSSKVAKSTQKSQVTISQKERPCG